MIFSKDKIANKVSSFQDPCVVVDKQMQILFQHGNTDDYFIQGSTVTDGSLLDRADKKIKFPLVSGFQEAVRNSDKRLSKQISYNNSNISLTFAPLDDMVKDSPIVVSFGRTDIITDDFSTPKLKDCTDLDLSYKTKNIALEEELKRVKEQNNKLVKHLDDVQFKYNEMRKLNTSLLKKDEELKQTNRHLESILNSINAGAVYITKSYKIKNFSIPAARMFNLTDGDRGKTIFESIATTDYFFLTRIKELSHQKDRGIQEFTTTDDKTFLMKFVDFQERINGDEGYLLTFFDVTEQKRTERALIESEERYRTLVDNSPAAVVVHSKGKVLYANQMCVDILQYETVASVIGMNLMDFVHPHDKKETVQRIKYIYNKKGAAPARESRFVRSDGSTVYVEVSGTPINFHGTAASQVVFRDISDRKRVEKEREELIRKLENKNRELEHFSYTISHDLKSPLITIKGFTSLLIDDLKNEDLKKAAFDTQRISEAATRMTNLIDDLLKLLLVGEHITLQPDVSLHEIIGEVIEMIQFDIEKSRCKIVVEDGLPIINADPDCMIELFRNLFDNSIKYASEQQPLVINITSKKVSEGNLIAIADNGVGINHTKIDSIFDVFKKAHINSDGTGVGLAIVKRIVEAHNGKIWVESDGKEKGARFYILFRT